MRLVPVNMFSPPVIFLTDRSKAMLLLWILFFKNCFMFFFYYTVLSVPCRSFSRKGLTSWLFLCVMFPRVFVTFPYGVSGQVWYLIVLNPDVCLLPYFYYSLTLDLVLVQNAVV